MNDRGNAFVPGLRSGRRNPGSGIAALWRTLHGRLAPFGIREVMYGSEAMPEPTRYLEPLFNSINPPWLKRKIEAGLFVCDEYVRQVRLGSAPLLWSDQGLIDAMSEPAKRSLALDIEHEVLVGVSVSMPFSGGLGGSAVGLHAPGLTFGEFDRVWARHQDEIVAIVNDFDLAVRRDHRAELFRLNAQETECLRWAAKGWEHKQIASRMGLSEKQVEKRLTRAREKLKVLNTTQAAVAAAVYGLISP